MTPPISDLNAHYWWSADSTNMVQCPRCGKEAVESGKEWDYAAFYVKLYNCPNCEKSFKAYFKGDKLSHTIPKHKQAGK